MATALIQFSQGATTGTAGQAFDASTGTSVSVANNSNTGVLSWQIDLVDVPSTSSLTTGTLAHSDNGSAPAASFTPDVAGGCYRVVLYVWNAINRVGVATDTDIRNVVVLDVNGFAIPPSQIWPAPLPPTASGLPGNKPNELNISAQERGWAGDGSDGLLDQRLRWPVITNVNISAGTTSGNLSNFVFSNSNSVSFGLNGSTITATVAYPVQSNQTEGLYALGNTIGQSSSSTFDARTVSVSGAGGASVGYSGNALVISVPNTIGQTNQTVGLYGLGNTTQNSSTTLDARTISFNGLGDITVGFSNGSVQISGTQTNQTIGLYGLGHTTQNSSTTLDARSLSFDGLGIVTVGYSNGSIQVSATTAQSVQTQNFVAVAAGTQTGTSGTVIFSNSNGISFGMSNTSVVTASYTVPTQTNQTVGLYGLGNTTQNSSTTLDARTLSFNGLGGITVGYSNGSIQLSGPQTVAQTNQTVGLYGLGNTTQNSSTTLDARTLSFNGLGIVTVGYSNGSIQISATTPTQTNQTVGLYGLGNTTQNSSTTLDARTISYNGLGIVTVGFSNGSVQISATTAQSNQTEGFYAVGNTTQNSSTTLDGRTHSFNGLGIITVGYSNGSIQLSATTPTQTNQSIGLYALGNTTQNSSTTLDARTLSFNGLGIVTVGYSNGSIQISVTTAQSAQTVGLYALGNTTQNSSTTLDARTISYNGLGIVTVGYSNGSVQISATTPAQTNQTIGLYALGNTTQNSSTTLDARTLSFNGLGIVTAGYSNGSIQISAAQSNQTEGYYAVGNTTGAGSSTTLDARTLSIQGAGIASVGYTNGSLVISVPSGAPSPVNFSAGAASGNLGSVVFSNSNSVSFGLNGSTITASINAPAQTNQTIGLYALGNTTQNSSTTLDARTISFNGIGAATMGYSNGSVQVSVPATSSIVGVGGIIVSTNASTISVSMQNIDYFEPEVLSNTSGFAPGVGSWYFQPFFLPAPMSGGRINRLMVASGTANMLQASNGTSFLSGTTGSRSVNFSYANTLALYQLGAGTNSTRLESLWSNTWSLGLAQSVSVSTSGATSVLATNAITMSYINSIDSNGSYTTTTLAASTSKSIANSSLATSSVALTTFTNILTGSFIMPVGFNTTINPGNYWLAQAYSINSTTGGQTVNSASVWSVTSHIAMSGTAANTGFRIWGQTAATSGSNLNPGRGVYSVVSASPMATVAFSNIRSIGSDLQHYFNFVNSTI